jgi:WD40 repeat protein
LAAASRADSTARVWDNDGNLKLSVEGHTPGIAGISLDPDGSILATLGLGEDYLTKVWQVASETPTLMLNLRVPPAKEAVLSDVLFLDQSHLLVADSSGTVRLFPLDARSIRERAMEFLRDHSCARSAEAKTGSSTPFIRWLFRLKRNARK